MSISPAEFPILPPKGRRATPEKSKDIYIDKQIIHVSTYVGCYYIMIKSFFKHKSTFYWYFRLGEPAAVMLPLGWQSSEAMGPIIKEA